MSELDHPEHKKNSSLKQRIVSNSYSPQHLFSKRFELRTDLNRFELERILMQFPSQSKDSSAIRLQFDQSKSPLEFRVTYFATKDGLSSDPKAAHLIGQIIEVENMQLIILRGHIYPSLWLIGLGLTAVCMLVVLILFGNLPENLRDFSMSRDWGGALGFTISVLVYAGSVLLPVTVRDQSFKEFIKYCHIYNIR